MPASTSHQRGDRAQHLAKALRVSIVSGELSPGAPLRQEELARRYETSRIPVREALRLLQAQGLVHLEPNKGAVVAPLDAAELRENIEMREAAEVLALRTALPHLSNAQIDEAAAIQDEIESSDVSQYGRLNKSFHMTLYGPCDRPRLLEHIAGLHDIAERCLGVALSQLDYVSRSSTEHRGILDACYARDTEAAITFSSRHILDAGRSLEEFLTQS